MQHERGPEVSITPLVPWGIQIDKKVSLLGCAARLGNTLFVEVQPPDSPEVSIGETGDDLQTDPLPAGKLMAGLV